MIPRDYTETEKVGLVIRRLTRSKSLTIKIILIDVFQCLAYEVQAPQSLRREKEIRCPSIFNIAAIHLMNPKRYLIVLTRTPKLCLICLDLIQNITIISSSQPQDDEFNGS